MLRIALGCTLLCTSLAVQSEIISFTATGPDPVLTTTWGALPPQIGRFTLSDHGDIHYDSAPGASMIAGTDSPGTLGGTPGNNLSLGTIIDASSNWAYTSAVGTTDWGGGCPADSTCIYGLRFAIDGRTHYGWAQFYIGPVESALRPLTPLTEGFLVWAYESEADIGIRAGDTGSVPEPFSLALVGLGLAALGLCRPKMRPL